MHFGRSARGAAARALAVICGALAFAFGADQARAAGGAYAVDDSEIGSVGDCKVESWGAFASDSDFIGVVAPACVVSLGRPVEISTAFARFREAGEWGTIAIVKGKTNLIPIEQNKFGVAFIAGMGLDLVTRNVNAMFVTVPVSFQVHEQVRLSVNAGWLGNPTTNEHVASWGAGFEWNFIKPLTLIGEVFGFAGGDRPHPRFQLGLRYTPKEFYDIDVIYGRSLVAENVNWITVGLNIRFNASGENLKDAPSPSRAVLKR